jgi:dihydrofolate reductase
VCFYNTNPRLSTIYSELSTKTKNMILSLIVAAAENNAIGKHNGLPWYLPEDLKFFKKTTLGKPVLMGRKTYESLGKPLPGRLNIVVSSKELKLPEGVLLFSDLAAGIERIEQEQCEEGFVIGGGQIFEAAMPQIERMYITRVHTIVPDADAFFPNIDHTHWKLVWQEPHQADDKHSFAFTFQRYERTEL